MKILLLNNKEYEYIKSCILLEHDIFNYKHKEKIRQSIIKKFKIKRSKHK